MADTEDTYVRSFEGSPEPADVFEPHMPGVDLFTDMDARFRTARDTLAKGDIPGEAFRQGQRAVAIMTPGRLIMFQPCPAPGSMPASAVEQEQRMFPPEPPLNISVVSYTFVKALAEDPSRCIPFLGFLLAWSYIGHSVVVFEGHPSAFEAGVRDSDVLLIDSGMMPFMQDDWFRVAQKAMRPGAKIFIHQRRTYTLMPVAASGNEKGWQISEFDGEASYANCLLTTLAKGTSPAAEVTSGRPLPNLAGLTNDPQALDWIGGLPFKYDRLDADKVIAVILNAAGWRWYHLFKKTGVFRAGLATDAKHLEAVSFNLTLTKDAEGRRQLRIER